MAQAFATRTVGPYVLQAAIAGLNDTAARAAMGEMLAPIGRKPQAAEPCRRALALTRQEPEQRHLLARIAALGG